MPNNDIRYKEISYIRFKCAVGYGMMYVTRERHTMNDYDNDKIVALGLLTAVAVTYFILGYFVL